MLRSPSSWKTPAQFVVFLFGLLILLPNNTLNSQACIGDWVFYDSNHNGVQDAGDLPYIGVRVWLYEETSPGNFVVVGQTTTDETGNYNFDTNNALIMPFTNYYIVVEDAVTEPGTSNPTVPTFPNIGSDAFDSDGVIASGINAAIDGKPFVQINTGPFDAPVKTYDFGFYTLCEGLEVELPIQIEACENEPVMIQAVATGGVAPLTYSWSDGSNTTDDFLVYTVSASEVFEVTVTDQLGCTSTASVDLLVEKCDFDISLSKNCEEDVLSVGSGQAYEFTIEVCNEGESPLDTIEVYDFLPSGYNFAGGGGWVVVSSTTALTTLRKEISVSNGLFPATGLLPGECYSFPINTTIDACATFGNLENTAVINFSQDLYGFRDDIDSNAGTAILDEDDTDTCSAPVFDLALRKTTFSAPACPKVGDVVIFEIEVFNQGTVPAQDVQVVDHIPSGMIPHGANGGWAFNGTTNTALNLISGIIAPGESQSIFIEFELIGGKDATDLTNIAEIFAAEDDQGNDMSTSDFDSTYDNDPANDPGGMAGFDSDDHIDDNGADKDGDGITDEDDHDPEMLAIFDLSLTKKVLTPGPYAYGNNVAFEIQVCNQGTIVASNVVVRDFIPPGFTLNPAFAGAWTMVGTDAEVTIPTQIAMNSCETVVINLMLNEKQTADSDWCNFATIMSAQDNTGADMTAKDFDSVTGSNTAEENAVEPGSEDDDNICGKGAALGEDEDDHDVACLDIVDVALIKVETTTGPYQYGDEVCYSIEVHNQGNVDIATAKVIDIFGTGLTSVASNFPDWNQGPDAQSLTHEFKNLEACSSQSIDVCFTVNKDAAASIGSWDNCAEVFYLEDMDWNDLEDIDSVLDTNPNNDAGGAVNSPADDYLFGDGTGIVGGTVAETDEDDHDCSRLQIVDLALTKTNTITNCSYGDVIEFEITVYNQGNEPVQNVVVGDYVPAGFSFVPGANPGWTAGAVPTFTIPGPIAPGATGVATINLEVLQTSGGLKDWTNFAEIQSVQNLAGVDISANDADSNPASNSFAENSVCVDDEDDNEINECGGVIPGEDEDDHDPAGVRVVDMALRKTVLTAPPYLPGSNVIFQIEVCNQGNVTVEELIVFDNFPAGMTFGPGNFPTWNFDPFSGNAAAIINSKIYPGNCETLTISAILGCVEGGQYLTAWDNCAEIFSFEDEFDNNITAEDKDSNADALSSNDAGGQVFSAADNYLDGDGTGAVGDGVAATDEDDHDCERLPIFDLALRKEVVTPPPYAYGQSVQFDITVCNQGNMTANNIDVTDYIPPGFSLDAGASPGWALVGTNAVNTITTALAPDQCRVVTISLVVERKSGDRKDWTNYAEITYAENNSGVDMSANDYDSTPGSNSVVENSVLPGDADDDNILGKGPALGEDEDDHDVAGIDIVDVALAKIETTSGPYQYGDEVCFDIEVTNQGNVDVASVGVVDMFSEGFVLGTGGDQGWILGSNGTSATYKTKTLEACATETISICLELKKTEGGMGVFDNCAEINYLEDSNWDLLLDIDSTPDGIAGNDAGGGVNTPADNFVDGDGTGVPGDGVAATDEDDHDCERIEIFDLALRKTTNTLNCTYGDKIPFVIEVFNQGNMPVNNVVVEDYFPVGLVFNPADNPTWNANGTYVFAPTGSASLMPGTSSTVIVILELTQTSGGLKNYTNYGEIISFTDASDVDQSANDADSTPASDSSAERDVCFGDEDDDEINECGPLAGEDEDDHDPAGIRVVDMALRKTVVTPPPYLPGGNVFFEIEVCNQGNITVEELVILDRFPAALNYGANNAGTWTFDPISKVASTKINSKIYPGLCETVLISAVLDCAEAGQYLTGWDNYAEIFSYEDEFDNIISDEDKDSNADAIFTNDAGGQVFSAADNYLDGDGTGSVGDGVAATDEDDHDCERLPIFDLALRKEVLTPGPYQYGQNILFGITVCNQGNITANNVDITDYIPPGYSLNTGLGAFPGWSLSGTDAVYTLTNPLAPNQCTVVPISLTIERKSGDQKDWTNYAEITYAEDNAGVDMTASDYDSTPGSNSITENAVLPGDEDDDNILGKGPAFGEDEDDHDVAGIEIIDVALAKKEVTSGPYKYGDDVCYDLEITNQGNVAVASVGLVDQFAEGLSLSGTNVKEWTMVPNSNSASYKSKTIEPCETEVVQICLTINKSSGGAGAWDNCAEIHYLEDSDWNLMVDIDSTPDVINGNDAGGAVNTASDDYIDGDASGIPGDGVAATDEDDHDCERLELFDLALRKTANVLTCSYGDKVTFTIEVFNQGNTAVQGVMVQDYMPPGLVFNPADNPSWNTNGTIMIPGTIQPGASTSVTIILEVAQTSGGLKDWANYAEIISFMDLNGVVQSANDADSTPGSNGPHERAVCEGDEDDDEINECGLITGEDEDDHDVEGLRIVDVALNKTTNAVGPFRPGDLVLYTVMVCNQGNVVVDEIEVFDNIPSGLAFHESNFPLWLYDPVSRNALATFTDPIQPGVCASIDILLEVQCAEDLIYAYAWDNYAEIYSFEDDMDNDITSEDKDSQADAVFNNDAGGQPWCAADDYLDGDGTGVNGDCIAETDEDDHDPERIEIFDLALKKELVTYHDPYKYGQLLEFKITVCNQGNIGAQDIVIEDYLPAGYHFDVANNPGWSPWGNNARYTIPSIAVSTCEEVSIFLTTIMTDGGEKDWVNYAEVISANNENGEDRTMWDFDSMPGTNSAAENAVEPGHPEDGDDDLLSKDKGGEEDDHDTAGIELLDLALLKVTTNQFGPFCYGDQIIYNIVICNQGSIQADSIQVTDYIPCGFIYDDFNDIIAWEHDTILHRATRDFIGTLDPGACVSTSIFLNLQQCLDMDINTFTNFAEISQGVSTDPQYPDILDVDSCTDIIEDNDIGGTPDDPLEDDVITGDKCAGTDEDDHDPERVEVFDLALKKELVTINDPYKYGQLLQFDITVCNQGNVDARNIAVQDYLPEGFSFDAANNPGWLQIGASPVYVIPNSLIQDNCTTFPIFLTIEQTDGGEKDWVNYAEIISATDLNGVVRKDADSNPASNSAIENLVEPDHAGDNDIESTDRGGEEDDHDPAGIELLDLALRKKIVTPGPFKIGSMVEFEFEIFNQGSIQASEIKLIDYIPCGLIYQDSNDDLGWVLNGFTGNATFVRPDSLEPGDSFTTNIKFMVKECDEDCVQKWTNYGEIWSQDSDDPDYPNIGDVDSNTDFDPTNDVGGTVSVIGEDNNIDGDSCAGEDEDDHDPELVPVYDLALQKRSTVDGVVKKGLYRPGDIVDFEIEIHNQGSVDAINTLVTDYLNYGFSFDPLLNPGWTQNGDLIQYTITQAITPCDSELLVLKLEIISPPAATLGDWYNEAEISGGTDLSGTITCDADSYPDTDPDNDNDLVDGPDEDVIFNCGDNNDDVIDEHIDDPCDRGDDDEDDNDAAEVLVVGDLCGTVWEDCNGDGIRNETGYGIPGIRVEVYDASGQFVDYALTNGNGFYIVKDLIPSDYYIKVIKPDGYEVTFFRKGLFYDLDSDIDDSNGTCTSPISYIGGGDCDAGNFDVGLYMCIPVGETVWYDINQNNVLDAFENGINGMVVKIFREMDGEFMHWDTQISGHKPGTPSDDGYFKFCVPPGTYYLEIDIPKLGLVLNQANVGLNGTLSVTNLNESTVDNDFHFGGVTDQFTINCEVDQLCNIGAGFFPMAQVGNRVWMDDNVDGLQSPGEQGVAGVMIKAFDSNNNEVNTTTTDANGFYTMDYLGMDNYYLKVYPPVGTGVTDMDQGPEDQDSDFGNMYGPNTTAMITLAPGDNIQNIDAGLRSGVVPVEWLYVAAENRGKLNVVSWATGNEVNVSHFEVERSLNTANNFVKIGENVDSNSPSEGAEYNIEDLDLTFAGVYYYRIKQIDFNGEYSYSDVVSVRVEKSKNDIAIYPNPAVDEVNVAIALDEAQEVEMDLYDAKGSLVMKGLYKSFLENGSHEFKLNLRDIPKGSYSIAIKLKNETIHKKLMIL